VHFIIFFIRGRLADFDDFLPLKGTPRVTFTLNAVTGNICPSGSMKQTTYGSKHFTRHFKTFPGICFRSTFRKEANPIDLIT